jgi:putative colanic acid biosynthesis acetyltransferase WcaF
VELKLFFELQAGGLARRGRLLLASIQIELKASGLVRHFQDLSRFQFPDGVRGRPAWFVQLWWICEALFVRSTPQVLFPWRRLALRLFGAKVGRKVLIRPGVRVTFPWKLKLGDYCWIGDNATLYNIENISIGEHSVVSQEAYLCTGTHNYRDTSFPLVSSPIAIESECWIAARAFIGPGVIVGHGAIVGACSVVLSNIESAAIVAGVPARKIGIRVSDSGPHLRR